MPGTLNRFHEPLRVYSVNRLLSGRINLREDQNIRRVKGLGEPLKTITSPGIAMRLKNNDDSMFPEIPSSIESGSYFCRMVSVIINDRDSVRPAFDLEAPVNPAETLQGRLYHFGTKTQIQTNRRNSGRVRNVMFARDV